MNTALQVTDVSKRFGSLLAVDSVSFDVKEGSILGVVGPNGAGKTTLFRALTASPFGPDSGEVLLFGEPIAGRPAHEICRKGLARSFQHAAVFDELTVLQNVTLAATYGRVEADVVVEECAEQSLAEVGLDSDAHRLAASLTLFEKRRLMIASLVATNPMVALLDEPAAGLNGIEQGGLAKIIESLSAKGITIVLIEHILPFMFSLCDDIVVMNEGRVLMRGSAEEIVTNEEVIAAYLGRVNS